MKLVKTDEAKVFDVDEKVWSVLVIKKLTMQIWPLSVIPPIPFSAIHNQWEDLNL